MNDDQKNWPMEKEKLFRSDINDFNNACLNFMDDQFDLYAVGYRKAAELLVEHTKTTNSNQDILVYPIVFLYRHYLELRMKDIIKDGNILLDFTESFPQDHLISGLWEKCKMIIEQLDHDNSMIDEINAVDENIKEFSKIDLKSMAFRYPTDKKGNPSLPGIKRTNLGNLSKVMLNIANFFDAASMIICVKLDLKRESNDIIKAYEAEFNSSFSLEDW
jgi:hypothetical protein